MNDDYWITPVVVVSFACLIISWAIGYSNGETSGRDKGIAYCMEQPKNCAIEYTYMKLKEKSK